MKNIYYTILALLISSFSLFSQNACPTISVNSATLCSGASATLTATGGNNSANYSWSPSTGLNTTTGATVTATPSVTTTYTVTYAGSTLGSELVYNGDFEQYGNLNHSEISLTTGQGIGFKFSPYTNCGCVYIEGDSALAESAAPWMYPTPDGGNAYFVGIIVPDSIIWENTPIINITPNTNYHFSFWVNQSDPNYPNFYQLEINNTLITTFPVSTVEVWQQFSVVWNSGSASQVDIKLLSSPSNATQYVAFDDFSFREMCINTAISTVVVNPSPVISVNSATICSGATTTLTATGAGTNNYTWSPTTALSPTTGAVVSATPTITTTYIVTGTNSTNCSNTATSIVTVLRTPTITVTSATICAGASTPLTASGPATNGTMTYTWSPTTWLSPPAPTGAAVTATPPATTIYTVKGSNVCGVSNTATSTVTVVRTPTITAVSSPATICAGSPSTLTASGPVTNGAITYVWTPSTALSATSGASVTANPTITTTYTVTGTNSCGASSNKVTVYVNPLPIISVNSATICPGTTATLTATGAGVINYTWSPATGLSATSGAKVIAAPNVTTSYIVTGVNSNGCKSTATSVVFVPNFTLSIVGTSSYCYPGGNVSLTASTCDNYQWYVNAKPISAFDSGNNQNCTYTSVYKNVIFPTPENEYYSVIGFKYGCRFQAQKTVVVNPIPTVTVNKVLLPPFGGFKGLTAVPAGAGPFSYQWNSNLAPATIVSIAPTIIEPNNTVLYRVIVTDVRGCKSDPSIYRSESPATEITEPNSTTSLPDLMLYPNPNRGNMTLNYSIAATDEGTITFYDMAGKESAVYVLDGNTTQLQINNDQLSGGTYLYKIVINNIEVKHDKIIITR